MKEKLAADIAVIVPAVSVTWLDMFDGGLKAGCGYHYFGGCANPACG
jgi:hypothetical protein